MNNVPEAVLQECLDFMEQGESIEQILTRYPELSGTLRPFLETAAHLSALAPQPSLAAKQKSQQAFLAHAKGLKTPSLQPSPWYRLRQILLPLVSLAVVLILFVTTAVSVSAAAIPGDALYPVKRLVENIRLNQTNDPEAAVSLMEQYRQERIREVGALLRTGRSAEVMFEGEIEAMQAESWMVAGIKVTLDAATTVENEPAVGEMARVYGRTTDGILVASRIEVLTGSPADPEAEPEPPVEPTLTSTPTVTATAEPTADPTDEPTATPTSTNTPTPTLEPTATITPSPTPTATPSPSPTMPPANDNDDDGNDNGDDGDSNENENENGDDGGEDNSNDNGVDSGSNENDANTNDNSSDDNSNDDNSNSNDDNSNSNDDNSNSNDDNSNSNDDNSNSNDDNSNTNDDSNDNNDNSVDD